MAHCCQWHPLYLPVAKLWPRRDGTSTTTTTGILPCSWWCQGVGCDWYPLFLTPGNTNAILQTDILCNWAGHISVPSSWWPWRSCTPSRQLLPHSISPKVCGHQADYYPPYWPWRSQAPGQPSVEDLVTQQGSAAALSIKEALTRCPEAVLDCKTREALVARDAFTVICCLQGLSDLCSFMCFKSRWWLDLILQARC